MNAAKARGTAAETAVVRYLQLCGAVNVERRALSGNTDRGDIAGIPGVVIEVKNEKALNLAGWLSEALVEQRNDNAEVGVVWAKRRGKADPADWYVVMEGRQLVALLQAAGYVPLLAAVQ